jgi:hypothetical protein
MPNEGKEDRRIREISARFPKQRTRPSKFSAPADRIATTDDVETRESGRNTRYLWERHPRYQNRIELPMQPIGRKLMRLHSIVKRYHVHLKDSFHCSPAGFIAIEHYDDVGEVFADQFLLRDCSSSNP